MSDSSKAFDVAAARKRCLKFRRRILDISQTVSAVHIAGAFSALELVDTIYFGLLRRGISPDVDDTFIMSKGHGSLAQYVALEELGVLAPEMLNHFSKPGWPLATHPDYGNPGIAASTGSLGHGLGLATGMAYADKMQGNSRDIYVVLSDGELMEGSTWEAMMTGPSFGITRIIAAVDLNDFQCLDQTSKALPNFYPIVDKVKAFGWETVVVNGHDAGAIYSAIKQRRGDRPFMLLAKTVKGKGVKYMENTPLWHYRSPNPEEYQQAIRDLKEITA